jgi:hypothetical protein
MGGMKENNSFLIKKKKEKKNPINPCFQQEIASMRR